MNKSQIKLTAILFGIFFPVLASTVFFMMKSGTGFGGSTNKGHLIVPVISITTFGMINEDAVAEYLPFDEQVRDIDPDDYVPRPWGIIYLGSGGCDDACMERLVMLRQIQIRLGPESARVQRYYLDTDDSLTADHKALLNEQLPQMKVLTTEVNLSRLLAAGQQGTNPVTDHYLYVVDPVGNVMLYFTPVNTPEDILSDLEKLLDQSSLG